MGRRLGVRSRRFCTCRIRKYEEGGSREPHAPKTGVYEFLPYRRGPFSFTPYYDLRGLSAEGWIVEDEHDIKVAQATDLETAFLERDFLEMIDGVSERSATA